MTDLAIHKTINKTRTIEGVSSSIGGIAYTTGNLVTLTLTGAKATRSCNVVNPFIFYRGVSKSNWSAREATTYVYDYKKREWSWNITGKYTTTSFAGAHNFYTDARLLIDDGGPLILTFQDKAINVFPFKTPNFTWVGGQLNIIDFTLNFIEGYERT